jgi:hypothetical protein
MVFYYWPWQILVTTSKYFPKSEKGITYSSELSGRPTSTFWIQYNPARMFIFLHPGKCIPVVNAEIAR